jgi:hypothetical protein
VQAWLLLRRLLLLLLLLWAQLMSFAEVERAAEAAGGQQKCRQSR